MEPEGGAGAGPATLAESEQRWPSGAARKPVKRPNKCARPGNFGGAKNVWLVYWRRRAIRQEDRWVLQLVRDYVPSLLADKGGEDNVSFAERKVMELAAVARVCWALGMAYGNVDAVARFVGVERQCLADLGLQRRAKPAPSLREVLLAQSAQEGESPAPPAATPEEAA